MSVMNIQDVSFPTEYLERDVYRSNFIFVPSGFLSSVSFLFHVLLRSVCFVLVLE